MFSTGNQERTSSAPILLVGARVCVCANRSRAEVLKIQNEKHRQKLLADLTTTVQQLMSLMVEQEDQCAPLTDANPEQCDAVLGLCESIEAVFRHGLQGGAAPCRPIITWQSDMLTSTARHTEEGKFRGTISCSFWDYICQGLKVRMQRYE